MRTLYRVLWVYEPWERNEIYCYVVADSPEEALAFSTRTKDVRQYLKAEEIGRIPDEKGKVIRDHLRV